jgi:hypothetical protein
MKMLIAATVLTALAGCSSMGNSDFGASPGSSAGSLINDENIFHSYIK